jgi:SAM-dependent methyltransferase
MTPYGSDFFRRLDAPTLDSARIVVPLLLTIIQPKSVADIGCGTGGWLSVFREHGIEDVTGVDGDYVDRGLVHIPSERFIAADLRKPLHLGRRFDLVVCLEVAEHLPSKSADAFVAMLTDLAPVVLFSAAIPFQGGVGHVNEQWPDYWLERFEAKGFGLVDCLRSKIWADPSVQPYIAQNLFLYVANEYLATSDSLRKEQASTAGLPVRMIHPGVYLTFNLRRPLGLLRRHLRALVSGRLNSR